MFKKAIIAAGLGLALSSGHAMAQATDISCDDLNWSAVVLERNPDIAQTCTGVYEKDGKLFAKAPIEVVRVLACACTFLSNVY